MDVKKKILVIDDEQDLRDNVAYIFSSKGYEVKTAVDGIDALEKLESFTPDLITLDMNMPRMDGLEFYQKIKGDQVKTSYPVLVLTARANMEGLFQDLDVDGFMPKPFEIKDLVLEGEKIIKKNVGMMSSPKDRNDDRCAKVCIVENDENMLKNLSLTFLESGFIVNTAHTGASAIKRISMDIPDVVVMKLKLFDISGDVVALKLQHNKYTKNIKVVLYAPEFGLDDNIVGKLREKLGDHELLKSIDPDELLSAVDRLLNNK